MGPTKVHANHGMREDGKVYAWIVDASKDQHNQILRDKI